MGVPYDTFWHLNPKRMRPIEKAYEMKLESAQNRMNLEAWLFGLYNQHAVASILSKSAKYPQKPMDVFGNAKKKSPQDEADEFARFMHQHNAMKRISKEVKDSANAQSPVMG